MKNFEKRLQEQLDKLPYTKHFDDGGYNDGQMAGFEHGARWANSRMQFLVPIATFGIGYIIVDLIIKFIIN